MATQSDGDTAVHPRSINHGAGSPTTPRPAAIAIFSPPSVPPPVDYNRGDGSPTTPTRSSVSLPPLDHTARVVGDERLPRTPRTPVAEQDVEMGDATPADDIERSGRGADDEGLSDDNDSVTSESQRPSKKKKGQRFYCTDFPPCQLSFTRSEHLARHIRKHTGERPFQCHCSRRFSRLDNLRQHAQTVHINEEIPGDSLAATSTRFQRQIRTDRVRPPGGRSRANTGGSTGPPSRGHSRNVSASSIASSISGVSISEENPRKRPQPLAMANDPSSRARLTLDTFGANMANAPGQYSFYNQSPTGYSTPASATTYSTETGSPHFGSVMPSPVSTVSRSSYFNGARRSRRLSVPSAQVSFQASGVPASGTYPPPYYGTPLQSPSMGTPFSPSNSIFGSPANSVYSHSRRESETELEYRRRTWHPSTYSNYSQRPATSGLSYHQTPDDYRPAPSEQPAASQVTRLPGIESFDHAARQQPSPMMVDATPRPLSSGRMSEATPNHQIAQPNPAGPPPPPVSAEGQWQSQYSQLAAPQAQYPPQPPHAMQAAPPPTNPAPRHPVSMPEPVTPRRMKRQAWYGGPVAPVSGAPQSFYSTQRPSPEDSASSDGAPTPSGPHVSEYHPVIVNPTGMPDQSYTSGPVMVDEQQPQQQQQQHKAYTLQTGHDVHVPRYSAPAHHHHPVGPPSSDMGRLEALVAVATSENRAADRT